MSAPPPAYNSLDGSSSSTVQDLRQSFATLIDDQLRIQELFKSVAGHLDASDQIGENHALSKEWNDLRQRHRRAQRDSQRNAGQCANFLSNCDNVLIPLARTTNMTLQEKQFMINKFLETIPVHQAAAKRVSAEFHEIGSKVECFPLKVAAYLRSKAEPKGFFEQLWTGLEELCMSIWQALRTLLVKLVNFFRIVLERVTVIRCSLLALRFEVEFARYSRLSSDPVEITPQDIARHVKEECRELGEKFDVFEHAWDVVEQCCAHLKDDLNMANGVIQVPQACDAWLRTAEVVYRPLVECLRAYSQSRSPIC